VSWYDLYIHWRLGPAARLVYYAFDNPDAWEADSSSYTITHKPSGLVFWVANEASQFKLYEPVKLDCFNRFERKVLWAKYEQWKVMYLFARMSGLS
jgi:hypothetical protein